MAEKQVTATKRYTLKPPASLLVVPLGSSSSSIFYLTTRKTPNKNKEQKQWPKNRLQRQNERHLAVFPHLGVVDRWLATPKRARIAH